MEGICSEDCQMISECECGEVLCAHKTSNHIMRGHNVSPLPQLRVLRSLNQLLTRVSEFKVKAIQTSELLIKQIEELTSNQVTKLLELELKIKE